MATPHTRLLLTLVSMAALAGCGKAREKVDEKIAEKVLETAMSKDGTQAKVDLSSGQTKITATDAQGKTTVMEMGSAQVTEADLGVPFYPGATPVANGTNRATGPDGTMVMASFESKDSVEKVAAFYREHLRAKSAGKQMADSGSSEGVMLMLADENAHNAVQISVSKTDTGAGIAIMSTQAPAK